MSVDLGIWGRLTRLMLVLFVLAAMLGVAVAYYPLLQQNERMRKKVFELDTQIQREEAMNRQLRASIDAMTKDRATIERLVREKLGYARPNENVIRFEGTSVSSQYGQPAGSLAH